MLKNMLTRFRQPENRRLFAIILASKLLGVLALVVVIKAIGFYFGTPAFADEAAPPPPAYVNPMNTMWTLVAAFLVFFMQVRIPKDSIA